MVIGGDGLKGLGEQLRRSGLEKGVKTLIVTNSDVAGPYADICIESLKANDFEPKLLVIDAGEDQKNLKNIELIHDAAYKAQLERSSLMIALGGGVVGDMTGFAAATWLRGVAVAQVPTTLLAMVDAAIGGKTGVNHPRGKNLIGAFHQPKLVLIDPSTLKTLPEREFRAGMAEVIKYGVIGDLELFEQLEALPKIKSQSDFEEDFLEKLLERSATSKARIVSSDERESGLRAILNYGHTFGHVVETLCGYGTWLHGEAVAIGMVAVGELAVQRNNWSRDNAIRQKKLIEKAGLPTSWPKLNKESILRTLKGDKKIQNGKIRFIIPTCIGQVEIHNDVRNEEIEACLAGLN